MQVVFGECELEVGEQPSGRRPKDRAKEAKATDADKEKAASVRPPPPAEPAAVPVTDTTNGTPS